MDEVVLKLPKEANAKRVQVKARKMNSVIWEREKETSHVYEYLGQIIFFWKPSLYKMLFSCGAKFL